MIPSKRSRRRNRARARAKRVRKLPGRLRRIDWMISLEMMRSIDRMFTRQILYPDTLRPDTSGRSASEMMRSDRGFDLCAQPMITTIDFGG